MTKITIERLGEEPEVYEVEQFLLLSSKTKISRKSIEQGQGIGSSSGGTDFSLFFMLTSFMSMLWDGTRDEQRIITKAIDIVVNEKGKSEVISAERRPRP